MGKGRDKKKKLKKKDQQQTTKEPKQKQLKKSNSMEDIDQILADFQKSQEAQFQTMTESNCEPPSRRANCAMVTNPLNPSELLLFGGEFYDGKRVYMYNDFYKYNTDKNEWKRITQPLMPGPRSSHQMVVTNKGTLFLFGGEFVSPNETNFFHYKDFWKMDLTEGNVWEKVECKSRPTPRSGHRMVCWKDYIVLFGGFFDQVHKTSYYDDCWVFNTMTYEWKKVEIPEPRPTPRSGFQFMLHHDTVVLYGGYSKLAKKGEKTMGVTNTDAWVLKLNTELVFQWERKKKIGGMVPGPRSGATMVYHKGKGFSFGGVSDVFEDEEVIESTMHGDLFQYVIDSNKFYQVNLKKPQSDTSPELSPGPRFNPAMAISKNVLYMFGGILEVEQKELTLSDFWTLNLDKLNEWICIIADENADAEVAMEEESESESQSEDDDNEELEEEEEDQEEMQIEEEDVNQESSDEEFDEETYRLNAKLEKIKITQETKKSQMTPEELDAQLRNDPQPGESMSEYYTRTLDYWLQEAMKDYDRTGKALRRRAFMIAYDRYLYLRPHNELIEKEMKENEVEVSQGSNKEHTESRNRNR